MGKLNLRRLRQNAHIRSLVREVFVDHKKFIQPLFVVEGITHREEVPGLTGTFRDTSYSVLSQIERDLKAGVSKFLLFGVPAHKKARGFNQKFTASQIGSIKKKFGNDLFLAVDVCLCSSTTHGQCGILNSEGDHVENQATVNELAKSAKQFAEAGADCVAPSDMMDGRVRAIRDALSKAGLDRTLLMSYSAKFHSKFYGPFRMAADSAPKGKAKLKDRATYQIDPGNPRDALACALRDADEGADILMVKPGLPYLDILAKLSNKISKPWAVYEVSGEFASIETLAQKKLIDGPQAHIEAWTAFFRAGASIVISYGARFAQSWIELRRSDL
ncbi:MAG: porphobilinogen synthase [Bdellovibrionota bacterium]